MNGAMPEMLLVRHQILAPFEKYRVIPMLLHAIYVEETERCARSATWSCHNFRALVSLTSALHSSQEKVLLASVT